MKQVLIISGSPGVYKEHMRTLGLNTNECRMISEPEQLAGLSLRDFVIDFARDAVTLDSYSHILFEIDIRLKYSLGGTYK